ncbi:SRPBCC family protein [Kribbella sp. DT2]|uniref:SRPBCC family protein n=1 Tax=Kribbella sp. DT2 TaxID=3393427 RepID=UPI003CF50848
MSAIVTEIEVDAPQADVFEYVIDPTHFPQWQAGVTGGGLDHDGPPAIGSVCHTTRRIGGRQRETTSTIVKYAPPHAWAVRGTEGPIRGAIDVAVAPVPGTTRSRVTISVDFTGHGIGRLLVPLIVEPHARKEMPANLARLKERLEARS